MVSLRYVGAFSITVFSSFFAQYVNTDKMRLGDSSCLYLLVFFLEPYCYLGRTAFVRCNQVVHSSELHSTHKAPVVLCILPSSYFLLRGKCAITSKRHCSEKKMRLTV